MHAIYQTLNVQTAEELARAARDGLIRELPRFGPRLEQAILDALTARLAELRRFPLADAAREGEALKRHLETLPGVEQAVIAGSYRRGRETVGDLDFIVVADDSAAVMDAFVSYGHVRDVLAKGGTRAAVRLRSGMQVDLRVVERASFGAALLYFTGSKAHNIALRRLALKRKLKINEYGVFKGKRRIAGDTEESVYATLGLRWIPPREREDAGEIERTRIDGERPRALRRRPTPPSRKRHPGRIRPDNSR